MTLTQSVTYSAMASRSACSCLRLLILGSPPENGPATTLDTRTPEVAQRSTSRGSSNRSASRRLPRLRMRSKEVSADRCGEDENRDRKPCECERAVLDHA